MATAEPEPDSKPTRQSSLAVPAVEMAKVADSAQAKTNAKVPQWAILLVSVVLSGLVLVYIIGLPPGLKGFGSGGSAEDEPEILPPADASASIKLKRNIDEVFEYVSVPHTWPLWHHGCDEVSGEVDSFAESGNRVRYHLLGPGAHGLSEACVEASGDGGGVTGPSDCSFDADLEDAEGCGEGCMYTPATEREIQWTFQQVREPKYSLDGDGYIHAVGRDVSAPGWQLEMRYTFKPSQRGKWTHFRGMLYWRGSEQGGKLSEKRQAMWTQFLEKSMQMLQLQLQAETIPKKEPKEDV